MVEKSSLKEKKQKTAQIIKASLLPRLREQADQAILKDFVFDIMRMLKENNGKSDKVLFGMKSAQRAIRRRQAKLVLVDSLLPKCISGEFFLAETWNKLIYHFRWFCRIQADGCCRWSRSENEKVHSRKETEKN